VRLLLTTMDPPPRTTPAIPGGRSALEALTAAALLLPGLGTVHAQPAEGVAVQFGRYQESPRAVEGAPTAARPLSADSLLVKAQARLPSGDGLTLTLTQDTWSGATPVSAAPATALGNRPVMADGQGGLVVVGASPMLTGSVLLDRHLRPVRRDAATGRVDLAPRIVHTMSSASPETRQQMDADWQHRVEGGAWHFGAGTSDERDFRSRYLNLQRRFDFDEGLSTLSLGASGTRSSIAARLDHDASPYITKIPQAERIESLSGQQVLRGRRRDSALSVGLVQVLSRTAVLEARAAHTRQRGDLSDPYRATSVIFVPAAPDAALLTGNLQALLERRPTTRRQRSFNAKLILHVAPLDGAAHLGYGRYRDDWGIRADRLEAEWFQPVPGGATLSARVRGYRQREASFYTPYLVSQQAYRRVSVGPDGQPVVRSFDPALLPAHFASDHRLGRFSTLTHSLGLSKPLARDLSLEFGIERTRHAGVLGSGSGFSYLSAHAGLAMKFDETAAMTRRARREESAARGADGAAHTGLPKVSEKHVHLHGGFIIPPGVHAAHTLDEPGSFMLGWRFHSARDARALRRGSAAVSDAELAAEGCAPVTCAVRPQAMRMQMHMLDLGWHLGDRWSLMVMPQYMTMRMDTSLIASGAPADPAVHFGRHESGTLGDTQLHLVTPLRDTHEARLLLGLGLSLPTGKTDLRHRRAHQQDGGAMDYTMQTGSGTWDLMPTLTVLGGEGAWAWGGQLGATRRLGRNDEGYALGHRWQATGWVGWRPFSPVAATLRFTRTVDGALRGERTRVHPEYSPADHAGNQGGRLDEAGIGLVVDRLPGAYSGTRLGIEWLLPLRHEVRGHQLTRSGGLALSWSNHF
jgi:hypothetical protein